MRLGEAFEFKFSETNADERRAFLRAVLKHDFRFTVCGYDKTRMENGSLEARGFHWGWGLRRAH
jgi:hypothetical protein